MKTMNKKGIRIPHTLVLIYLVVIFCSIMTYFIPVGVFDVEQKTYVQNGEEVTRTVLKPETFRIVKDENGNSIKYNAPLFGTEDFGGKTGALNAVFEGMVSGDKWGPAVGVIAFVLVIGGAFAIVMRTGAIDNGLNTIISISNGKEYLIIPLVYTMFSLGGATFGMNEEVIPFVMILAPMTVAMGYDSVTALMITIVASEVGFATSWMNPFGVALAQSIADIPVLSGAGFRMVMWLFFTIMGVIFTMNYARKIKKNPSLSVSYESDDHFRNISGNIEIKSKLGIGDKLVLLTVVLTVIWVVYGVVAYSYYIPEIASQFFVMGLISGIIGVIFKLNNMEIDDIATSFQKGAADLLGAALVIAIARGILIVLGGVDANTPSVLNTILSKAGNLISVFPPAISAWFMFIFQSIFNFFIISGSGQAALTMPLMAPLSDIAGVTRQVGVLAYQLGDGFTNLIFPTAGVLIACLSAARLDYIKWAKFQIKYQALLFLSGSIFIFAAVLIGLN
ncbi:MAG: putative rane protein [Bacillota bacterium]|jgi:uncharacterized ion transporter superfamily protein YfcC|nr:putative rane protein [Bacillota bacterium]